MNISITKNEFLALKACLNYSNKESQLDDNFSNGGIEEFMSILNWNINQVKGLISSLEQKGLGYNEGHIFWISELGVETVFNYMENNQ